MTEKIFFYYMEEGLLRLVTSRLETRLGDPVETIFMCCIACFRHSLPKSVYKDSALIFMLFSAHLCPRHGLDL